MMKDPTTNLNSENFKSDLSLPGDNNHPDINAFNEKLEEIDSPYFSIENFNPICPSVSFLTAVS